MIARRTRPLLLPVRMMRSAARAGGARPWDDESVFVILKLAPCSIRHACPTEAAVLAGDPEPLVRSLDGIWKFRCVRHSDRRPREFLRPAYDDREWAQAAQIGVGGTTRGAREFIRNTASGQVSDFGTGAGWR